MKIQVRCGVFETNSSSEHSLSIVKKSDFDQWKSGKLYARLSNKTEFEGTWGNFWSYQYYWKFELMTKEEAEKRNKDIFDEWLTGELKNIRKNIEQSSDEQYKKSVEAELHRLDGLTYAKYKEIDKLCRHMWITYDEYQKALRDDDCHSPFEHANETEDIVVFGKYFHS